MSKTSSAKLIEQLKAEEGCRLNAYRCTEGFLTIGCGYNIYAKTRDAAQANVNTVVIPVFYQAKNSPNSVASLDQTLTDAALASCGL